MNELSETGIKTLPVPEAGYKLTFFPEASRAGRAPVGFAVRVTAAGTRSFLLCYRDASGEHRATIGKFPAMSLVRAVGEAAKMRLLIDGGATVAVKRGSAKVPEAKAPKVVTVNDVIDDWVRRVGADLRTLRGYEGAFRRAIRPALGEIPIATLNKAPIRAMLDAIPGPSMRDKTIVYLGSVLNWYAARVDDFVPPVLRGLKGKKIARERLLDHDEIRELWPAFGAAHLPSFGVLCKLLLLTGQRKSDWADAHWSELSLIHI